MSFRTVVENFPVYGFRGLIRDLFGFLTDFQEIRSGIFVFFFYAKLFR